MDSPTTTRNGNHYTPGGAYRVRHELFRAIERERIQAAEKTSWLAAWIVAALLLANLVVSGTALLRGEWMTDAIEGSIERVDTANRLVGMAEQEFKRGNLENADKLAHEALLKDPSNYVCWLLQGHLHAKREKWRPAIECYQNARRYATAARDEKMAHVASLRFDHARTKLAEVKP